MKTGALGTVQSSLFCPGHRGLQPPSFGGSLVLKLECECALFMKPPKRNRKRLCVCPGLAFVQREDRVMPGEYPLPRLETDRDPPILMRHS